jgi:hypothetical protein
VLVVFSTIVPKSSEVVDGLTGATPDPVSPTVWAAVASLSITVIAPGYKIGTRFAVGWKMTEIVQVPLAAITFPVQVSVEA